MKGIIVVDKETGKTSRDIVNSLCKILGTKKVGHTGTLDPLASGVLIVCFGKYTKLVDLITSQEKEYIADVKLGILTDTLDVTGNVLEKTEVTVNRNDVEKSLGFFVKEYEQEVPIYSAVKIGGKKLYEYARNNESVVLPKRMVNIKSLELLDFYESGFKFKASVSKGTYIRSLILDICKNFNSIGVMSDLIRTKQGDVDILESYKMEDIRNGNYKVLCAKDVLDYPIINLTIEEKFKVENGAPLEKLLADGYYFLYFENKEIAIYEFIDNVGKMKVYLKDE